MKPLRASDLPNAGTSGAIRIGGVTKSYKMYREPRDLLIEALTGRKRHSDKVVLQDISLDIAKGEVVGLIGANGAGKSTLLKIITGTLQPTFGSVSVAGRIAAILELGTGFNPNYSGRENVILSGMLRGMTENEIRRKFDDIVAFSGLETVIDQPFHTYSSGMQARLAFATAISVDADVIIIDEALAAGDVRFASKSLRRIREISRSGVTCLFVSHVTYQIMQLCSRAIWLDGGRMRMDGPAIDVVRAYEYEMHRLIAEDRGEAPPDRPEPEVMIGGESAEAGAAAITAPEAEGIEESGNPVDGSDSPASSLPAPPQTTAAPTESGLSRSSSVESTAQAQGMVAVQKAASPAPRGQTPAVAPQAQPLFAPLQTASAAQTGSAVQTASAAQALGQPLPHHHSTGKYQVTRVEFLDAQGRETRSFRFGDVFRLRVAYERLEPGVPDVSCGLAVAFNRVSDFEAVMYFNTNYPHSDEEMVNYEREDFRQFRGRRGVIEARIEPLQLTEGTYYVSFGLLPNYSTHHEFYEYFHCHFSVHVLPSGFREPSVFYPLVHWTHGEDRV